MLLRALKPNDGGVITPLLFSYYLIAICLFMVYLLYLVSSAVLCKSQSWGIAS